jgi:hypothetical protein
MILDELRTLPEALVADVDPLRLQQYLRATGWVHNPRVSGKTTLYQRPEAPRREQVLLPLSRDLADFTPRLAEAVAYLAQWEKRPALELLRELLLPEADLVRFTETGPETAAGDVALEHAAALLSGARQVLLASACRVLRPRQAVHPHLGLPEAAEFLARCRLGPMQRGSFVLSVACPVGTLPSGGTAGTAPLARQVTLLLMRSLDRLARALEGADVEAVLAAAGDETVLSANLCEGLLEMTPAGEDAVLTIATQWAKSLPLPTDATPPGVVRLRHDQFGQIERLANRLRAA